MLQAMPSSPSLRTLPSAVLGAVVALGLPLLRPVSSGVAPGGELASELSGAAGVGESASPVRPQDDQGPPVADPFADLRAAFAAQGIGLDAARGIVTAPADVAVVNDLLEYLLVMPHGAAHEALFVTTVDAEVLNTALLTLGVAPGINADWAPKDPAPSQEEIAAGASPYEVRVPEGDGLYLYAAWREGDEVHLHRIEDLVRDRFRGRTLRRHRFVYLGSAMTQRTPDDPARFAASTDGNLINVSFFKAGHTLLTTALEECVDQSAWLANAWLLPPVGSTVQLVFARERLVPDLAGLGELPQVAPAAEGAQGR